MKKNIIIAVSGTGGHVYPGIALAYELKKANFNPVFIVNNNKNGVSFKIVKDSGYEYELLNFKAPVRKISLSLLLFPFSIISAFLNAKKILKKTQPKAVIGMGAYLSFPVLMAAKLNKFPTLIHEQNSIPGLANKILSKFVTKVAVSFKSSQKYFDKNKTVYTSNPVRKDIFNISRTDAAKKLKLNNDIFTVFIFGGSLGATKLNNIMIDVAKTLVDRYKDKIQFIHITGNNDFEIINEKYSSLATKKFVTKYMNDIGNAYACCDFIFCRAGAGTVKEIEFYDLPTIFVPFPYATDNHQYFNAISAQKQNYRIVIEEKNIDKEEIINFIELHFSTKTAKDKTLPPKTFPQELLAKEVIDLTNEKI